MYFIKNNSNYNSIEEVLKTKEAGVIIKKGEKYGVINLDGETIVEPNYEDLKEAKPGILICKKNGKYVSEHLDEPIDLDISLSLKKQQQMLL